MGPKRALITGITGQDGSYLAEFLLERGYEVHGIVRRVAAEDLAARFSRIVGIQEKIKMHNGDIQNSARMLEVVDDSNPHECYHLASQSFVHTSFADMRSTISINNEGTMNMLCALQEKQPHCRFYFAASSEMFGKVAETPQKETTPFHPRSPYGVSKVFGYDLTRNFRESYGMFAVSGMLFNHESPRRGQEFVTRKITRGIADIIHGNAKELRLGNLSAKRDWGFAGDYVKAMWLMLQQPEPDDYVIATGEAHSVQEFLEKVCSAAGLKGWQEYVHVDPSHFRPAEVQLLVGDASKAKEKLGWTPKTSFDELVEMMVKADVERAAKK